MVKSKRYAVDRDVALFTFLKQISARNSHTGFHAQRQRWHKNDIGELLAGIL
jgi:hypothetical protein